MFVNIFLAEAIVECVCVSVCNLQMPVVCLFVCFIIPAAGNRAHAISESLALSLFKYDDGGIFSPLLVSLDVCATTNYKKIVLLMQYKSYNNK